MEELASIAHNLVAPTKGLLAADDSLPTTEKRFVKVGLASTEENRRSYRELVFTTGGIEEFISGVIMFDETIRQAADDGTPLIEVIKNKGIIPGIKVDQGTEDFQGHPGEKTTKGLPGLSERLKEYKNLGARFTKWRAVYAIDSGIPSAELIQKNAEDLSEYAKVSQEEGFVAIPEPEVLMDGDHSIAKCEEVTATVLERVFEELSKRKVELSAVVLKTNMVLPGKESDQKVTAEEVAEATIRTLRKAVPTNTPGIVFLSGGQSPEEATVNLNAINKMKGEVPWELGFSFARGLLDPVLNMWRGNPANSKAAQEIFLHRAKMNSLARQGKYLPELENEE